MSYVYSNEIKYADSLNLDAFGRVRSSNLTTLLDIKFPYTKLPLLVDEQKSGSSTSVLSDSSIVMSVGANEYVVRQTIASAPYQSGKSQLVEASFSNFQLQVNVIKRVGYYTSTTSAPYNTEFDGFFLESNGSTGVISFQIWRAGVNVLTSATAAWYTTDYDVSLIDWSKTQLMFVDFQWLGVGRLRFALVIDGIPKLFTSDVAVNNSALVYMAKPNKPMRYEIRSTGGTGSFTQICCGVSMEGSINSLFRSVGFTNNDFKTFLTAGTTYPLLGTRLGSTYRGISGYINSASVLQNSNDNYILTVQKNPVLSGSLSWSSITDTPIEYSNGDGTVTVTTPGHIVTTGIGASGTASESTITVGDNSMKLGHLINGSAEEWWLCITPITANATFYGSLNINYFG